MLPWIITIVVGVILIGGYVWLYLYTRKRQRAFDADYAAAKERHEVFVLHKKVIREKPKTGWMRFYPLKTYQVIGRISLSQAVRGIHMSKMQTLTFHTSKKEFDKIQGNHKYKMDVAGNYIGLVLAPTPVKDKKLAAKAKTVTKGKVAGPKQKSK